MHARHLMDLDGTLNRTERRSYLPSLPSSDVPACLMALVPSTRTADPRTPPPAHRTPAGTPLICLCPSEIHKDDLPSSPHGLSTLQITSINFSFSIKHQLQPSAVQTPDQPTCNIFSIKASASLNLPLHQLHRSLARPLRSTTYTRRRLFRRLASTSKASQLLQQQQPQCLLSDLLTFLPARAPRPADLCLLCPNESRRPEDQTSTTQRLLVYLAERPSSSMVSPDLIHGFTTGFGF
ncbi:hypothetical protein M419DRAFT_36339 [Trichoderma reesei RUT C-30]|uniref:Uncharacterized protein n=1 Tax=Hypocrea jecorina (strain ATCC 56765 / BCRC 32924 / NRRL 11460 / Rut C-30) TaxID=1344414 RepID=A0A024S8N9_HYPJR|nr:hypothetical protein M419DRAFT_36339 [Trichoderma reesei RUT C-30]